MADDLKTHGQSVEAFLWASDRESSPETGEERQLQCTADGELFVNVFASNTDATEDEAAPAAIVGTPMMMERDDALSTLTPVEGDWAAARATAEGALWTEDANSDALLADTNAMVVDLAAMEVLLTTIDSDTSDIAVDTGTIATDMATVAGAVAGTEMQVDVVTTVGLTDTELRATPVETQETRSDTAATTTPTIAATTTEALASNVNRKGGIITNPTGGTTCYLNFGAAATTSHHELAEGSVLNLGAYTGAVNAIASSGTQVLTVTEFT